MASLEYRLLDEVQDYPVLFRYETMAPGEIAARFACDQFIKDSVVYEKTSCAIELLTYVIYVNKAGEDGSAVSQPEGAGPGVKLEIRQDWEGETPGLLIESRNFSNETELILQLQSDYFYWLGDEWLKTLTVINEDRKVYIYYAKRC